MFSTAKEVHVYVENAIQNVASNRKQSINPRFIDMVLNNAVPQYISSKFPDKQQPRDIESTLKRYTDFNVLKTTAPRIPETGKGLRSSVLTKVPSDCLKLQSVLCSYKKPILDTDFEVGYKYSVLFGITEQVPGNTLTISYNYRDDINDKNYVGDLVMDDVVSSISSKAGMFYLYDSMVDRLRNLMKLDCKFISNGIDGLKYIRIDFPIGYLVAEFISNNNMIGIEYITTQVIVPKQVSGKHSAISILSSYECQVALDDYYGSKHLHLNPIGELSEENLVVYYTDFLPTKVEINYIRKPKLFDITTGQIPEIDISKDFLDYAVAELLLVLNSPSFEKVVGQNIKNL